jgi:hypothetical protein
MYDTQRRLRRGGVLSENITSLYFVRKKGCHNQPKSMPDLFDDRFNKSGFRGSC